MKHPAAVALIDCDNFFASCERVFRPDTWGKPVIVLSNNDGCVIARSREARDLGIPMAVPFFKIKTLAKAEKVFVFSANFALYGDMSQRITELLKQVAPRIEVYSIDESFADLSLIAATDYEKWAERIQKRILKEVGIPVSIGVAPTKTLAKAASTYAKKQTSNHVWAVSNATERQKLLDWLPLQDIWGIGWRLGPKLQSYGVSTPLQLVSMPEAWLQKQLTIKGLATVKELKGEPVLVFDPIGRPRKSIMYTRMFGHHLKDIHQLESAIASFTARAVAKLRSQNSIARDITVFLRPRRGSEARTLVAFKSLSEPSAHSGTFIAAAVQALVSIYDPDLAYDKAGVIITGITSQKDWQLSLISPDTKRDQKQQLMQAVDEIRHRFGSAAAEYATEHLIKEDRWVSKHVLRSPGYTTSWLDLPLLKTVI